MTRRRKILLLALCGLIAVVAVCFFCLREREPSYNGRTLSEWIDRFGKVEGVDDAAKKERAEAAAAIRQIGTNAVPTLLRRFAKSEREAAILRRLARVPGCPLFLGRSISERYDRDFIFVHLGLGVLGTNASSALPELARSFASSRSFVEIGAKAFLIRLLDVPGQQFFLKTIEAGGTNYQRKEAISTVGQMREIGPAALEAVPVLLKVATNRNDRFCYDATRALGELRLAPDQVLPVFTNRLASTNEADRLVAIEALNDFASEAKPAIPAIKVALTDPSAEIRQYATNILLVIAPEVFTNKVTSNN